MGGAGVEINARLYVSLVIDQDYILQQYITSYLIAGGGSYIAWRILLLLFRLILVWA
jgi:hypothetical protein